MKVFYVLIQCLWNILRGHGRKSLSFNASNSFLHPAIIKLEFGVTNLSSADPYIAISYEWGSDQIVSMIELDDGSQIGKSATIKYVLGRRRRKQWVWMDAICIDQNNEVEKRHQIHSWERSIALLRKSLLVLVLTSEAVTGPQDPRYILEEFLGSKDAMTIALVNLDPK